MEDICGNCAIIPFMSGELNRLDKHFGVIQLTRLDALRVNPLADILVTPTNQLGGQQLFYLFSLGIPLALYAVHFGLGLLVFLVQPLVFS